MYRASLSDVDPARERCNREMSGSVLRMVTTTKHALKGQFLILTLGRIMSRLLDMC